jgi:histidinol-phosphatase (PHP family)
MEEGGRAVTFGSDAHGPDMLAANFPEATAMLEYLCRRRSKTGQ